MVFPEINGEISVKFDVDIHGLQEIKPNSFGEPWLLQNDKVKTTSCTQENPNLTGRMLIN